MIERELDYAYLHWSIKCFVCSKLVYGRKFLHRLLLLRYFPASISQDMVKKGESVVCYASGFLNDPF